MALKYEESYLGQLRQLIGKQKVFAITARAIIQDETGRILFVKRSDNGAWVMPAGSIELGESILDCVKREVKEEAGLDVVTAVPIAIYSDPKYSFLTAYGDPYQLFSIVFLVKEWCGELATETDETIDARFFKLDDLPPIPEIYQETLQDLQRYDGQMFLK